MSKKKKKIADELVDLKLNENETTGLNSDVFALESSETDVIPADAETKTVVNADQKDQTIRLVHTSTGAGPLVHTSTGAGPSATSLTEGPPDKDSVKVSYGLPSKQQAPRDYGSDSVLSSDDQLKHSEHLRIAQRKINDLEEELVKLRKENEDLASAGETFKRLNDDYYSEIDQLKAKLNDVKQTSHQEIKLLKQIGQNKDKEITELKQQVDDYKSRIDNNFQRVRKREKDLEHRLEIAKIEEAAVVKSKDQLILNLKRRIDEITNESENFRKKSQENYRELQKKQQVMRGAIRALRIALTKLEGDDDSDFGIEPDITGTEDEN